MDTMTTKQTELIRKVDWRSLTAKESLGFIDSHRLDLIGDLTNGWVRELQTHEHLVTETDYDTARQITGAWLYSGMIPLPMLIPVEPGFGKSTLLKRHLYAMVRLQPDIFGAIVVMERVEDLKEFEAYINVDRGDDGKFKRYRQYAFRFRGIKGTEDEDADLSPQEYHAQYTDMVSHNIVLMTTKQFELQTLKGSLQEYAIFRASDKHRRPRRNLFVDEKPALTVTQTLGLDDISTIDDNVYTVGSRGYKVKRYVQSVEKLTKSLKREMKKLLGISGLTFMNPIDTSFEVSKELAQDYARAFGRDELYKLRVFEQVVSSGGTLSRHGDNITVTASYLMDYDLTMYNTFILDGTSADDYEYGSRFFLLPRIAQRRYPNFHLHICKQFSMSKSAMRNNIECLPIIAEEVEDIAQNGSTVAFVHKEFRPKLESLTTCDNVRWDHHGNGRGTNKYEALDRIAIFGLFDKSPAYYSQTVRVLLDGIVDLEKVNMRQHKEGRKNKFDPVIEDFRTNDLTVSTTQTVHRVRMHKKNDKEVHCYLYTDNDNVISELKRSFPGCKVHDHYTYRRLNGEATCADKLIEYFGEMEEGDKVKGRQVYTYLSIPERTFREVLKNQRVIEAMKRFNIVKQGHSFVKIT